MVMPNAMPADSQIPVAATQPAIRPFEIDIREAVRFKREFTSGIGQAKRWCEDKDVRHVDYDNLAADTQRELERVQRFLSVTVQTLPILTRKQATRPLDELVTNYEELRAL
jgi:hypothetical protein